MLRSENFGFRLSCGEKALLLLVSETEERTASDVLRRLIRQQARRYGLWPPTADQDTMKRGEASDE